MTLFGFLICVCLFGLYYGLGVVYRDRAYAEKGLTDELIIKDFWHYGISPLLYGLKGLFYLFLILFLIVSGLFLLGLGGDRSPSRPTHSSSKPKLGYDSEDEIRYEVQRRIDKSGSWMMTTGGSSDEAWSSDRCDELADANPRDSYRVISTNKKTGKKLGVVYVRQ